jgi:hypothetical protein
LKDEKKNLAILCVSERGPCFGGHDSDIWVKNNCNANASNRTSLRAYINDTGLDKGIVFTGSLSFQVEEIEVFEITA